MSEIDMQALNTYFAAERDRHIDFPAYFIALFHSSVLHDMLFRLEIRVDIENGIGNEQGTRVGGNPFYKDMAHAPGGR
ncbi:MAG TPA: hypothetical protein VEI53_10615, partial [Ktedonobacteraceae bacterium]|nr:hypothetical protein [Ktedonobacteraceae bacterium]